MKDEKENLNYIAHSVCDIRAFLFQNFAALLLFNCVALLLLDHVALLLLLGAALHRLYNVALRHQHLLALLLLCYCALLLVRLTALLFVGRFTPLLLHWAALSLFPYSATLTLKPDLFLPESWFFTLTNPHFSMHSSSDQQDSDSFLSTLT